MGALVQIATVEAYATTSATASFLTPVTAGNCIVVVVDESNSVFGTVAPTGISSSPANTFSSVGSVTWAVGGGHVDNGIYAYVALNAVSVSSVSFTFADDGNGIADRQIFIAEYSGVLITSLAIDGFTSFGGYGAGFGHPSGYIGSTILTLTTSLATFTERITYKTPDALGAGVVLFALLTSSATNLLIAATWAHSDFTPTRATAGGFAVAAKIGGPSPPANTSIVSFYFDAGGGNHVFGGPSRQGPPG